VFALQVRQAIEAAPRSALSDVSKTMWQAFTAGFLTEAEAETLSALIETRKMVPAAVLPLRKSVGSRPRSDASMERRRRWAASGRMPPAIAARFTLAEAAVLAVVANEVVKRADCRMAVGHIAAVAGVGRSTVKAAIRRARMLGLLTVQERTQTAWRNLPNILRITSPEWVAWNRLARRSSSPGGGVKTLTTTNTQKQEGAFGKAQGAAPGVRTGLQSLNLAVSGVRAAGGT